MHADYVVLLVLCILQEKIQVMTWINLGACHVQVPHIYLYARSTPVSCHMHGLKKLLNLANQSRGIAAGFIFAYIKFVWRKFRWAWLRNGICLQSPFDTTHGELPSNIEHIDIPLGEVSQKKLVKLGGLYLLF